MEMKKRELPSKQEGSRIRKDVEPLEPNLNLISMDPIQAYLGNDVDMHRANEVRPILKRVAAMAERTGCAVILIGHMNKAQGLKSGYRGPVSYTHLDVYKRQRLERYRQTLAEME